MEETTDKQNQPSRDKNRRQNQKLFNDYIKYSGLGFQMVVMLLLGYWLGHKLDIWLNTSFPVFTIVLLLLFLFAAFYSLFKNLPKN